MNYLDSPATTAATTYAVYFASSAGTSYINDYNTVAITQSTITVMEIGA